MTIVSEAIDALLRIPNTYKFLSLSIVVWLCWKVYRFTILPWLHPSRPLEYPYSIPVVGHVFAFFNGSNQLMEQASQYFGETRDPFALNLGAEVLYLITSPQSAAELYKNTSTVSVHAFVKKLHHGIGLSETGVHNVWTEPVDDEGEKTGAKYPQAMIHVYHHEQLSQTGPYHQTVTTKFIHNINHSLEFHSLQNSSALVKDEGGNLQVSLWELCCQVFVGGISNAYAGNHLVKIFPDIVKASLDWEETNWKFIYDLPAFLSRDNITAKKRLEGAFVKYFESPIEQRSDSSHFVRKLEQEFRAAGLSVQEMSLLFLLNHWAITGNIYKQAFWVMAHIIHDKELYANIRKEILKHSKHGINIPALLNDCPHLDSVYNEVLRVASAGALLREVLSPTVIGSKTLTEGQKLIIPWRLLHLSEAAWGPNPKEFNPERFLKDKSLTHSLSFRPFGGGAGLCPGRFLTRQAIFTFIATLVVDLDASLATTAMPQTFPKVDEKKPGIGIMAPVKGDDLIISLKKPNSSIKTKA